MSKFKVGDRVVRRACDCQYTGGVIKVGDIGIVTSIDGFGWITLDTHPKSGATLPDYYDLALESELERLVRVANEGADAVHELSLKYWCDYETREHRYVVKPKPTFEPFYVGPLSCTAPHSYCGQALPSCTLEGQWLVSLTDNFLSINFGARTYRFKAYDLMCALSDLTKNSTEFAVVSNWKLGCMREGICVDGRWQISWSDADRILAELEKAEVANV
jgi:hypothetical protein